MRARRKKHILIWGLASIFPKTLSPEWEWDMTELLAKRRAHGERAWQNIRWILGEAWSALHAQHRRAAIMGLVLLLTLTAWLASWMFTASVLTVCVSVSDRELHGLREVADKLEKSLGATIVLESIDRDTLVATLEKRIAAGHKSCDLICVDNDNLGILIEKELIRDLSPYQLEAALPSDRLFQNLRKKHRIDGRDYVVPFHPNVKLLYYNQDILKKAGKQPPTTYEEFVQLARELAADGRGRVALQAHRGKAAAVTLFEWVASQGGDPLTLDGPGAQQAFRLLWNLAPYLEPESDHIQFDTATMVLVTGQVSIVDNWPFGIKEVMETFKKTHIKETSGLQGSWTSVHVLGGDVLAIPRGAPHPEDAIKLIKQLIAKQTQYALAEQLFWAPVRGDVYVELSAQPGTKEYFDVIQKALQEAVVRPLTPAWGPIAEVLSDALQAVLRQGRAQGTPATAADITALLGPYAAHLRKIPREFARCELGANKIAGDESCEGVEAQTEKSIRDVAQVYQITPTILAKVNGRSEWDLVSPITMPSLLVPKLKPRS
jgi:trehalose transport system substrate-binding protein